MALAGATALNDLLAALASPSKILARVNNASIATQATGGYTSMWRATGTPTQGAIPGAAAVCTKSLTGALWNFPTPSGSDEVYLALVTIQCSASNVRLEFRDRLAHMGGLSGVTTGAQTVSVDVSGGTGNLAERCNQTTYEDVDWWADIYTDIGTTAQTCTVTYTNAAGTTGRTTTFTLGGASPANQDSRRFPIIGSGGEFIRSVQTVSIPTSTGTAGSWGITANKLLAAIDLPVANQARTFTWAELGLPLVADEACLGMDMICGTTSTGTLIGNVVLITT